MTLIAAFRCYGGAILCADTLEVSSDGTQAFVRKIEPKDSGEYELAVAGAGNATLIDGFVEALRRDARTWKAQQDEDVIGGLIRNVVMEYHDNEVRLWPEPDDRMNHFIVCAKPKGKWGLFLWEIAGTVVLPIGDYSLLGYMSGAYKHEIRKLYHKDLPMQTALILGIHLFSLAKGMTSQIIGGDTDAIYVHDHNAAMQPVSVEDMRILEQRVNTFDAAIAKIVLACPDFGATFDSDLYGLLENFVVEVMNLRGELMGRPSFMKMIDARAALLQRSALERGRDNPPDPQMLEAQTNEPPPAKKKRNQPSKRKTSKGRQ